MRPRRSEDRLAEAAADEVARVLASLDSEIRARAEALPVTFMDVPSPELEADGIAPDTLGLFLGPSYFESMDSIDPRPPQIVLFVANIRDYARWEGLRFRDEARTTYLHELGHYLGWDEDEIARQGLG